MRKGKREENMEEVVENGRERRKEKREEGRGEGGVKGRERRKGKREDIEKREEDGEEI
jgi:hypothetical protein